MTDRELLELAARAASLSEHGWMGDTYCHVVDNTWATFDPLTDDGDALRLAVKLKLDVVCGDGASFARMPNGRSKSEPHDDGCAYAATRRAIVRAAAEIGKAIK